ncbi:MAG: trypsin-like peptidase domain-containing protein, partial [Planctomycetes bacterium]|nr:trypsin-like peptidase domain-containing protein [Planctomycetota bacterium]
VVNISTTRLVKSRLGFFGFGDDFFDDIFQSPFIRDVPVQSLGSGFIIHPDGYIVTNEHVVRRAMKITVYLADKTTYEGSVIAADPAHDLAILKISSPPGRPLPALTLGRSDNLMIGETVVAIGNPKGYRNSTTVGVISALGRELEFRGDVKYSGLIQTDASINPGNSGGPLLNVNAEVIGINTAIRPDAQGIGFAIAIDDLTEDLPRLLDFQRVNRVVLGLSVHQVRRDEKIELVVDQVTAGSPADKAGLKPGQLVLAVDGQAVHTLADFYVHMLGKKPGDQLAFESRSNDTSAAERTQTYTIGLIARPKPDGGKLAMKWLGLALQPITPELAKRLGLPIDRGLLVSSVLNGGPADTLGVKVRDVLFQLGRNYVATADDVGQILEDAEPGQVLQIGIGRGHVRYLAQIRLAQTQ